MSQWFETIPAWQRKEWPVWPPLQSSIDWIEHLANTKGQHRICRFHPPAYRKYWNRPTSTCPEYCSEREYHEETDRLQTIHCYQRDRWNWNPPFEGAD